MAGKKKQEEVKQQVTPQNEQDANSEKKAATSKKAKNAADDGTENVKEKTPTLESQYKSLKEKHPDAVLLFRRGDFYHTVLFFIQMVECGQHLQCDL